MSQVEPASALAEVERTGRYPATTSAKSLLTIVAASLWVLAIGVGLRAELNYSFTAGLVGPAPHTWPVGTNIKPQANKSRLIMFAHPQCSCSRATLHELSLIMARYGNKVDTYVLVLAPPAMPRDWIEAGVWRAAEEIPGVHVLADRGGAEARRFGAFTSGECMLYDAGGRLEFSGGITVSRGHQGANRGSEMVVSLLENGTAPANTAPVFGCSLLDRQALTAVHEVR